MIYPVLCRVRRLLTYRAASKTRVIECSARIQWIIQRRINGGHHPWQSQYFCRTREGLLRYAPKPIPPELLTLPDRFPC